MRPNWSEIVREAERAGRETASRARFGMQHAAHTASLRLSQLALAGCVAATVAMVIGDPAPAEYAALQRAERPATPRLYKSAAATERNLSPVAIPMTTANASVQVAPIRSVRPAAPSAPTTPPALLPKAANSTAAANPVADVDTELRPHRGMGKGLTEAPTSTPPGEAPAKAVWSAEDVETGRLSCERQLAGVAVDYQFVEPQRSGECGTPSPIAVSRIGIKGMVLRPAVVMNCRVAARLARWVDDTLQPAALETYGVAVRATVHASGYTCRNRYGLARAPISEHAFANAVDIAGFELADGRRVSLVADWGPTQRDLQLAAQRAVTAGATIRPPLETEAAPAALRAQRVAAEPAGALSSTPDPATQNKASRSASLRGVRSTLGGPVGSESAGKAGAPASSAQTPAARFLRRVRDGACSSFSTVLGPEANEAHRDHFHFDLRPRTRTTICQ